MSAPFGLDFDIGSVVVKPCPIYVGNLQLTFRIAGHGVAKVSLDALQRAAFSDALGFAGYVVRQGTDWQKVNEIARGDS